MHSSTGLEAKKGFIIKDLSNGKSQEVGIWWRIGNCCSVKSSVQQSVHVRRVTSVPNHCKVISKQTRQLKGQCIFFLCLVGLYISPDLFGVSWWFLRYQPKICLSSPKYNGTRWHLFCVAVGWLKLVVVLLLWASFEKKTTKKQNRYLFS